MEVFLSRLFLIVVGLTNTLGNYWFTFGLWPINWWSFVIFSLVQVILALLWVHVTAVEKTKS